jgi:hypothetical protein
VWKVFEYGCFDALLVMIGVKVKMMLMRLCKDGFFDEEKRYLLLANILGCVKDVQKEWDEYVFLYGSMWEDGTPPPFLKGVCAKYEKLLAGYVAKYQHVNVIPPKLKTGEEKEKALNGGAKEEGEAEEKEAAPGRAKRLKTKA